VVFDRSDPLPMLDEVFEAFDGGPKVQLEDEEEALERKLNNWMNQHNAKLSDADRHVIVAEMVE
jgi:hypothetical protein